MTDDNKTDLEQMVEQVGAPKRRTFWGLIRTYFITGIVVTAPIAITIYLTLGFVEFVDETFMPLVPRQLRLNTYLPFSVPVTGVIAAILFFIMIGAFAANFMGRYLVDLGDRLIARTPVVRVIYGALKQIFETVVARSTPSFDEVVLVEYPRKGIWSIGFVTSDTKGEIRRRMGEDMLNVFIPTTPNPTSGFLLFIPKADAIYLDMSVEEAAKKIISAGIVTPEDAP